MFESNASAETEAETSGQKGISIVRLMSFKNQKDMARTIFLYLVSLSI